MNTYVLKKKDGRYLKIDINNQFTYTSNITLAEQFASYNEIQKFYKNKVSKKLKPQLSIEKVTCTDNDTSTSKDNTLHTINNQNAIINENQHFLFTEENFNWSDACNHFQAFLSQLEDYKLLLQKDFEQVEAEWCDIRHKIEFPKNNEGKEYDAVDGYKLFKMEREVLRKRRYIKDEKKKVQIALNSSLEDYRNGTVVKQLENINNQKYQPRALIELFEGTR